MNDQETGIVIWQVIIILAMIFLVSWIYGRILHKAGYSRWWVALLFIPLVNIIMIWVFAFADWPNLKKISRLS